MKQSIAASSSAPSPRRPGAAYSGPPFASPAASTRAGKSPVARFQLSPAGNLAKCGAGRPGSTSTRAADPLGWVLAEQLGAFPGWHSQNSHCGVSHGMGRPVQPVVRVSLACSLGNVSPGCNCCWLLVSGAGVQWPRCKSNENAVFPMLLRWNCVEKRNSLLLNVSDG